MHQRSARRHGVELGARGGIVGGASLCAIGSDRQASSTHGPVGQIRHQLRIRLGADLGWAPGAGQAAWNDLTGLPGIRRIDVHGKTPHSQHRLQAPGRSGVSCGRDAPRPGAPPRPITELDPDLGGQVRGRRLRRGCRGGQHDPGMRGPDRGARAPGRQAGAGARVSKEAQRQGRQPRSAPMSVITGPKASPSPKDAE